MLGTKSPSGGPSGGGRGAAQGEGSPDYPCHPPPARVCPGSGLVRLRPPTSSKLISREPCRLNSSKLPARQGLAGQGTVRAGQRYVRWPGLVQTPLPHPPPPLPLLRPYLSPTHWSKTASRPPLRGFARPQIAVDKLSAKPLTRPGRDRDGGRQRKGRVLTISYTPRPPGRSRRTRRENNEKEIGTSREVRIAPFTSRRKMSGRPQ